MQFFAKADEGGLFRGTGTILNGFRFALAIFSGKNIFNFGFQESLRTFLKPISTGGGVKANGRCSAAFYESAALRLAGSPSPSSLRDSSPKGERARPQASSPSQSPAVTALPKGEPLAKPVTLHLNR